MLPIKPLAQTIRGKVEGKNGETIPYAKIIVKDSLNAVAIKEFLIVRNGGYQLVLKEKYQRAVIQVSANNYLNDYFVVVAPEEDKEYLHNFRLLKDTIIKLADVVVKAKQKPFRVKGDTITYVVAGYTNGTERKIQDVIKKMPGMAVDEKSGEIKYKGRSVETVKLDGEDLFGNNYSIGTKNINVDMVEQVQALENYVDNPLLKGLESREKVALNLVLKKNRTDLSGNVDLGLGIKSNDAAAVDASANVLGISGKYKSFATVSYNNIGINNSPFDYFSYNPSIDEVRSLNFTAKKYLQESFFNSELDAGRRNVNNSFFGSYNAVFKPRKNMSVKANLFVVRDRIDSRQLFSIKNSIGGQDFLTTDNLSLQKSPAQSRADIEIKMNPPGQSLLEYQLSLRKEKISTIADVIQNEAIQYNTELFTRDTYLKQTMLFTKRLGEKKALQLSVKRSSNDIPQEYLFNPAVHDSQAYEFNRQHSRFIKRYLDANALLIGKAGKQKYSFSVGAINNSNDVRTNLSGLKNQVITNIEKFDNDVFYRSLFFYNAANWKISIKRWKFTPSYKIGYLHQELVNHIPTESRQSARVTWEPGISIGYRLNSFSLFSGTINYIQKPFSEEYLFSNPIYTSNRSIQSNEVSLQLQKSTALSIYYLSNNMSKQFQLNLGLGMFINKGNYFSNLIVEPASIRSLMFYLPLSNKLLNANFMVEKYVSFLSGTVRVKSTYSKSNYQNIVNQSGLRQNTYTSLSSELFFKTALDIKVNFENNFRVHTSRSSGDGSPVFANNAVNNNFQVIVKPGKDFFFLILTDYYRPGSRVNRDYLFVDATLNYSPSKGKYTCMLSAKNLLNHQYFSQLQTNDYSTTLLQNNLLSRYCMLSISRKF
jgi:hypothetical protein